MAQGGQISNIPYPARDNWSEPKTGNLTPTAIAVFEELNTSLSESIQDGQLDPNGVLYGDSSGNLQSLSVTDYTLIYGSSGGVPQTLTFGQDQFIGTLAADGLINMSKLQVTDQLDLTGMVGKTQGAAVSDAVNGVASTVSVTSPDATDLATVITLSNELKVDVNALVTDLNAAITAYNLVTGQLNALLNSLRGGDLIDT